MGDRSGTSMAPTPPTHGEGDAALGYAMASPQADATQDALSTSFPSGEAAGGASSQPTADPPVSTTARSLAVWAARLALAGQSADTDHGTDEHSIETAAAQAQSDSLDMSLIVPLEQAPDDWATRRFPAARAADVEPKPGDHAPKSQEAHASSGHPSMPTMPLERSPVAWAVRLFPDAPASASSGPPERSPAVWAVRLFADTQRSGPTTPEPQQMNATHATTSGQAAASVWLGPQTDGKRSLSPGLPPDGRVPQAEAAPTIFSLAEGATPPEAATPSVDNLPETVIPAQGSRPNNVGGVEQRRRFIPALPSAGPALAQRLVATGRASAAAGMQDPVTPLVDLRANTRDITDTRVMPLDRLATPGEPASSALLLEARAAIELPTEPVPAFTPQGHAPLATWNGLPAPWEPLPRVDLAPPRLVSPVVQVPAFRVPRSADGGTPPNAGAGPMQAGAPAPDLEELTDQVYARLRRRISAERRLFDLD